MRYCVHFALLILFISLFSCSKQNNRLIVDEIFISKHSVGPPVLNVIRFDPRTKKSEYFTFKPDTSKDFCFTNDIISESVYRPKFIFKIDNTGRIIGYTKNCDLKRKGYFNTVLPDSMIVYINNQIIRTNYEKLDTLYNGYGEGFTEYYFSIKNDDEEKNIMIMQDYKRTKIIRNFIDSLYKYANTLKLYDTLDVSFRRDTLIVLKTEKYWDSPSRHLY